MFTNKGPTSRRQQPPLKSDEKQVLRKKVKKSLEQKYVAPRINLGQRQQGAELKIESYAIWLRR
jgi:hypothetical protein